MQVTETLNEGLKRGFTVVVPNADIEARIATRLTELKGQIRLPGFRPGKVPEKLLRQRYGDAVRGEVLEKAVQDTTEATLTERSLRPAAQPNIDLKSADEGKDLEFSIDVEVLPEIELGDFTSLKLERLVADVPESEVDDALSRMAETRKVGEVVESKTRKAKDGDVVVMDFVGRIDGEAFEGGSAERHELELGSGQFIPGFEEQLVGVKAGEEKVVTVSFPENYGAENLAGKEAEFTCTVHEIKELKVPAVDDEFAKSAGFDDLDALKSAVRESIAGEYGNVSRMRLKRVLLDELSDGYDFPVPEGMVDAEFHGIWHQIEHAKERGELDEEDAAKSEDDLKAEYRGIAERRVRLGLLLSEVGTKNNVQVDQNDLQQALMAEVRKYPGQEQAVFQYYQSNQQALESLRAPIFEEKVVDFILELAHVTEKKVSVDDLTADPDEAPAAKKPAKKAAAKKPAAKKAADKAEADKADGEEAAEKKAAAKKPAAKKAPAKKAPAKKAAAKKDDA